MRASSHPPTTVRLATEHDAAQIAAIYRPAVADAAISFELEPPGADEMARRVSNTLQRTPWLVAEPRDEPGNVLGYAYASAHKDRLGYQWSVDVSVYVSDKVHRRGIGRRLYEPLFSVLRMQGFVNAYAGLTLPNPASEGLHRALGFEPIAVYDRVGYKFGAWHSTMWLWLALGPHEASPVAPRPLPSVMDEAKRILERAQEQ